MAKSRHSLVAGIQKDKDSAKRSILILTCSAGVFDQLDSRLRENDEVLI